MSAPSDLQTALLQIRDDAVHDDQNRVSDEELMRRALLATAHYRQRFSRVWRYRTHDSRKHPPLAGVPGDAIDLVAEQIPEYGGGLCAIGCFPRRDSPASAATVEGFLAASDADCFQHRIFVTTEQLGATDRQWLARARPRCEVVDLDALSRWPVRWLELLDSAQEVPAAPRHAPRPHQVDAIEAMSEQFTLGGRARLVMPCGAGKTLTAMWAAEKVIGTDGTVLYLSSAVSLIGEATREWAQHRLLDHVHLGAVCEPSRPSTLAYCRSVSELQMPVACDSGELRTMLRWPARNRLRTIFGTYRSLEAIAEALPEHLTLDMVVCDEAHHAGDTSIVHDGNLIPARFKLFLSYPGAGLSRLDNETLYGPDLSRCRRRSVAA